MTGTKIRSDLCLKDTMLQQKLLNELASALKCDTDRAEAVQVLIDNIEAEVKYFKDKAEEGDEDSKEYRLAVAEEAAVDLPFLVAVKNHLLR